MNVNVSYDLVRCCCRRQPHIYWKICAWYDVDESDVCVLEPRAKQARRINHRKKRHETRKTENKSKCDNYTRESRDKWTTGEKKTTKNTNWMFLSIFIHSFRWILCGFSVCRNETHMHQLPRPRYVAPEIFDDVRLGTRCVRTRTMNIGSAYGKWIIFFVWLIIFSLLMYI